jgi:hypothetical protein
MLGKPAVGAGAIPFARFVFGLLGLRDRLVCPRFITFGCGGGDLGRLGGMGSCLLCAVGGVPCATGGFHGGLSSRFSLFSSLLRGRGGFNRSRGYRCRRLCGGNIPLRGPPITE